MFNYLEELRLKLGDDKFDQVLTLYIASIYESSYLKKEFKNLKNKKELNKLYTELRIASFTRYSRLNLYKFKLLLLNYILELKISKKRNLDAFYKALIKLDKGNGESS